MENLRGMALMTLAMASFATSDSLIKLISDTHPAGQILMVIGVCGAVGFGVVVILQGDHILTRAFWHPAVVMRNLGEGMGTSGFITALTLIPFSTAAAVIQVTPLLVTLGAAMFMGEKVGWRRWAAIAVGFIGVMIIIRPGIQVFDINTLFAVQGAVGMAIRDLASRAAPKQTSSFQLGCWGFGVIFLMGCIMLQIGSSPAGGVDLRPVLALSGIVLLSGIAVYTLIAAMRVGDVAVISPFRYTRLVFVMILAIVFFGERPDLATWVGASIVVGSGLYTFWRERKVVPAA